MLLARWWELFNIFFLPTRRATSWRRQVGTWPTWPRTGIKIALHATGSWEGGQFDQYKRIRNLQLCSQYAQRLQQAHITIQHHQANMERADSGYHSEATTVPLTPSPVVSPNSSPYAHGQHAQQLLASTPDQPTSDVTLDHYTPASPSEARSIPANTATPDATVSKSEKRSPLGDLTNFAKKLKKDEQHEIKKKMVEALVNNAPSLNTAEAVDLSSTMKETVDGGSNRGGQETPRLPKAPPRIPREIVPRPDTPRPPALERARTLELENPYKMESSSIHIKIDQRTHLKTEEVITNTGSFPGKLDCNIFLSNCLILPSLH